MFKIKDAAVQGSISDGQVRFEEPRIVSKVKTKRKRKIRRKKSIGKDCSAQLSRTIEKVIRAKPDITEKELLVAGCDRPACGGGTAIQQRILFFTFFQKAYGNTAEQISRHYSPRHRERIIVISTEYFGQIRLEFQHVD